MTRISCFLIAAFWGCSALPVLADETSPDPAFETRALTGLHVAIVDPAGAPLDARVQVLDMAGTPLWPRMSGARRYDAYSGHHYFYAPGEFTLGSRAGAVRIIVSHGFEYATYDGWIPPTQGEVRVTLRRLFEMNAGGWYSGDTHVHPNHGGEGDVYTITPDDLAEMARAEDVNVVCALSNGPNFAGRTAVTAGPDHLLHYAMEYRSALFGHMDVLGLNTLLQPGCCLPWEPAYPLNLDIATAAHAQHAVVLAAHPASADPSQFGEDNGTWPASGLNRELPVGVVLGGVDGIDVLSYSNLGTDLALQEWFDMLNLGYRPALTAGTDASVNRWFDPPMAGYRVYAHLKQGEAFTLDSWLRALTAGNTFVTNGPLPVKVTLGGKGPGQTVYLPSGSVSQLAGTVSVYTKERLQYLDVIYNGSLRSRYVLPFHMDRLIYDFTVTAGPTDAWVVFRLTGPSTDPSRVGTGQVAITSPIFIKRAPREIDPALQNRYDDWIGQLQDMVESRPPGDPGVQQNVLNVLQTARSTIIGVPQSQPESWLPENRAPAPVPGPGAFRLIASGGALRGEGRGTASVQWFDPQGRLLRVEDPQPLPAVYPVPHLLPPGVYFARLLDPSGTPVATARIVKTD